MKLHFFLLLTLHAYLALAAPVHTRESLGTNTTSSPSLSTHIFWTERQASPTSPPKPAEKSPAQPSGNPAKKADPAPAKKPKRKLPGTVGGPAPRILQSTRKPLKRLKVPSHSPSPTSSPPPPPRNRAKIRACLRAHNAERRLVGVPLLRWSRALEATAQEWADLNRDRWVPWHSRGRYGSVGENLHWNSLENPTYRRMHVGWIREKKFFRNGVFPQVTTEPKVVGHYTQMVWRDTRFVGCASAVTTRKRKRTTFVCHYQAQGNVPGRQVY